MRRMYAAYAPRGGLPSLVSSKVRCAAARYRCERRRPRESAAANRDRDALVGAPPPGRSGSAGSVTTPCVWPVNYRNACQLPASLGCVCLEHLTLVRGHVGKLDCAWPGCARRAWDRKGLCSFHWDVTLGLIGR
jgi:hypothetical protein